jgi:hypothetical protein
VESDCRIVINVRVCCQPSTASSDIDALLCIATARPANLHVQSPRPNRMGPWVE